MHQRTRNFKYYFLVLLLIYVSGSPLILQSTIVREIFIATALLCSLFCLWPNDCQRDKLLPYAVPFALISIIQLIIFPNASFASAFFLLLKLYIGYCIISFVGDKFAPIYTNIMIVLSGISLIFYLYNTTIGFLPGIPFSDIGVSLVVYTELFTDFAGFINLNSATL